MNKIQKILLIGIFAFSLFLIFISSNYLYYDSLWRYIPDSWKLKNLNFNFYDPPFLPLLILIFGEKLTRILSLVALFSGLFLMYKMRKNYANIIYLLGIPVVLTTSISIMQDSFLFFFSILLIYGLETKNNKLIAISALILPFVKYTGLVFVILSLILYKRFKFLLYLLPSLPWFIKNYVQYGNPFYLIPKHTHKPLEGIIESLFFPYKGKIYIFLALIYLSILFISIDLKDKKKLILFFIMFSIALYGDLTIGTIHSLGRYVFPFLFLILDIKIDYKYLLPLLLISLFVSYNFAVKETKYFEHLDKTYTWFKDVNKTICIGYNLEDIYAYMHLRYPDKVVLNNSFKGIKICD